MASLYIHFPFCERKCVYCDFYSLEGVSQVPLYLASLFREIDLHLERGWNETVETVYLGGGTPSLLSPPDVERLLRHNAKKFRIAPEAEITLETNPGTVSEQGLKELRSTGVNRLSIGVQSLHDSELAFLGRIHSAEDAARCVRDAHNAGFANISVDLIYAVPGQNLTQWHETLARSTGWGVQHISAYSLIVEENTPLIRMVQTGAVTPLATDEEAGLFEFTMEFLEQKGFHHYEVSNYAVPGYRSRHNLNYWNHENYLGLGPSAHSFRMESSGVEARRWWNYADLGRYRDMLGQGSLPVASHETIGRKGLINERIFLGLRSGGIGLSRLDGRIPYSWSSEQSALIDEFLERGLATDRDDTLRLTRKGYLLCDEIAERLMLC